MASKSQQLKAGAYIKRELGNKRLSHNEAVKIYFLAIGITLTSNIRGFAWDYLYSKGLIKESDSFSNHNPKKKHRKYKIKSNFYESEEWDLLRVKTLNKYGCMCMKCSSTLIEMHVDHIKPRSKYPHLELDENNLQVLCRDCNIKKSNKNEIDYRPIQFQ